MNQLARATTATTALFVATLGLTGCAPTGTILDEVMVPGRSNTVLYGEVRSVDTRSGRIQMREDRGRNVTLRYDNRTRVVYRQRSLPVGALERGDLVTARVSYARGGQPWVDRIDVRDSARDRGRGWPVARTERVTGTVGWVDSRRNTFALSPRQGRAITVQVTGHASRSDRSRFDRLRRGQRVSVEVRQVSRDRYQLVRFR